MPFLRSREQYVLSTLAQKMTVFSQSENIIAL